MPTQINKLDPTATVALRGFAGFGAAAAITQASASGFTVSGVFRAADDFAVVVLYDSDDFYEHPRNRYLPDFDFSGIVLEFEVLYDNLQPLDSQKFPTIDFPYLDVIRADGTSAQIPLFAHATQVGGVYAPASAVVTVAAAPAAIYDRVTIWYQNNAADFIASGGESAATVASTLATAINASWPDVSASASGPNITITAKQPGADGNLITLYTQSKTATLTLSPGVVPLAGGSSAATWRVSIDFTALGIDQVRQLWLTLAPALANGAAYAKTEWMATFSNWTVTGAKAPLKVAGPGSVRVEEDDAWCTYKGVSWVPTSAGGFYSQGFAKVASTAGDSVTVSYWCQATHDVWIGTALYTDRGKVSMIIDNGSPVTLDTFLNSAEPVVTRRKVASAIAPGQHTITITLLSGLFYFDFLEAAVSADVPDALAALGNRSAALDYDTDSTYKLSPQRLMATFDNLGLAGPMNLYGGVFWALQRTPVGGVLPVLSLDLSQTTYSPGGGLGDGDQIFVNISGQVFGKTVFPLDDAASIAAHFAYFVNEASTGVWASASGSVLTLVNRAAGTAYSFTFSAYVVHHDLTVSPLASSGALTGGQQPDWYVDPSQTPALARGFRDWLADLCAEVKKRGYELAVSFSMEFVFPPDDPASGEVWAQRWPDNVKVETATGFSTLVSTQCSFTGVVLAMHVAMFGAVAGIQAAAGLTPQVQFGEFSWWYFADAAGMAFYDAETAAAAEVSLGRSLHVFQTPDDDPSLWPLDSAFLAGRLASYVQALASSLKQVYPSVLLEWLLPLDVNYPQVVGKFKLGGRLLYAVNVPAALIDPGISPFDLVKMEALDFGSADHNMNLAAAAMAFPFGQGWPAAKLRYLVPIMNGTCAFLREQSLAEEAGYQVILFWAVDHLELFGFDVRRVLAGSAQLT